MNIQTETINAVTIELVMTFAYPKVKAVKGKVEADKFLKKALNERDNTACVCEMLKTLGDLME